MTTCPICDSVQQARSGAHPHFLSELKETLALLSDNQGCPGWCVLLLKDHHEHLAALPIPQQLRIFEDVARTATAIRQVFGPIRINYECLGNQVPHIHWHIIPRHPDDPTPTQPVWGWPPAQLRGNLSDQDRQALRDKLRSHLPPL
jgi:diadenosine tetraphosphate (Ap4A) HIT family hydrolase